MSIDLKFHQENYLSKSRLSSSIPDDATSLRIDRDLAKYRPTGLPHEKIINEIYEIIRSIRDPEHPYTLEQLNVVREDLISVKDMEFKKCILIEWIPVVPNYRFASHIGLCMRCKLEKELKSFGAYKIDIYVKEGTHKQKGLIDKQINDKERVQSAKENDELMKFITSLIDQKEKRDHSVDVFGTRQIMTHLLCDESQSWFRKIFGCKKEYKYNNNNNNKKKKSTAGGETQLCVVSFAQEF